MHAYLKNRSNSSKLALSLKGLMKSTFRKASCIKKYMSRLVTHMAWMPVLY